MPDAATIAEEYFKAFNRRDWDGIRALLHPEYSYTGRNGQRRDGPDAGIANSQMYDRAFPGLQLLVQRIHAAGDVAIVEFVPAEEGDARAGSSGPTPWICTVLEMKDGKVHTEREYWQRTS
jgi:ketosteroid isomerase-like protein